MYAIKTDYESSVSSKINAGKRNARSMPLALIKLNDQYACVRYAKMIIRQCVALMVLLMLVSAT